ncbi:Na/Pi cotransporter family protein [Alcaligenes sp. SDU_A2]|uniref:Na/Pi cotransporter family protein n=1 Tax=Alcaligenes sp. SDU_A2 TaxID=3136634 RepID=UPI00311FA54E
MKEIFTLLDFGGYIALLMWGVHMVQSGVQRAFGAELGVWMGRALGRPRRAFLAGAAITAAIQSSTATGLMITSFAAGGLVALVPGLAAMLGANVGTTLIVQLLSFQLTALAPALILLGVWLFRAHQSGRRRDLGRVFIGLGLLLLSLHELVALFSPIQDAPLLQTLLQALSDSPVTGLVLAALLTWAAHSSVAIVVLIISLAGHHYMDPQLTYALVLGANLGTAINPVLEGTGGDKDPANKRLPLGNLGTRVVGCILGMLLLPWIPALMNWLTDDPARAVANFHTIFNLAVAALFMPLLKPYARLLSRQLPRRNDPDDPGKPLYLDESAHEVPAVALGNAAREALRLSDMLQSILGTARQALISNSAHNLNHARYINNAVSRLDQLITAYLAHLDQENLSKNDMRRLNDILAFSTNMAHAATISVSGLLTHTGKLRKQGWLLQQDEQDEIAKVMDRLIRNQRQAAALFVAEDVKTARFLAFEKDFFRDLESSASDRHISKIKSGQLDAADQGSLYLEILRDVRTINSYLVNAAAYPILAKHDELLPNRVRDPGN